VIELDRGGWDAITEAGLLGLPFARRHGGRDADLIQTMEELERLGRECTDGGLVFAACSHIVGAGVAIHRFGSDELKDRYLPHICDGSTIGAHAISEPNGGSDALNMETRAVDRGDHFVITGTKAFVTNGPVAGLIVVYARTGDGAGPFGVTAFAVETDAPGVTTGPPIPTMGLRSAPLGEVVLDGCEVAAANVVGRPGSGFLVLDHVMKWEVLCSFAASAGAMRRRLERCIEYARTRHQFGRPIGSYQSIANKVVDMKIAFETARRWLYDTAECVTAGREATVDLAITKLVASEANVASALAAVQIFGANGYTDAYGLEADLRDAVAGTIYSGTSEIQRNRIASMLGVTP
jgi:alkylation response protein AidB-like acyl-CoA dehydrogenase